MDTVAHTASATNKAANTTIAGNWKHDDGRRRVMLMRFISLARAEPPPPPNTTAIFVRFSASAAPVHGHPNDVYPDLCAQRKSFLLIGIGISAAARSVNSAVACERRVKARTFRRANARYFAQNAANVYRKNVSHVRRRFEDGTDLQKRIECNARGKPRTLESRMKRP